MVSSYLQDKLTIFDRDRFAFVYPASILKHYLVSSLDELRTYRPYRPNGLFIPFGAFRFSICRFYLFVIIVVFLAILR